MINLLLCLLNYTPCLCLHRNVETTKTLSYCPDCGKLIRTNWYIIRCSCCGKKRIGLLKYGKIIPHTKFCTNCGTNEYEIEKLQNLSERTIFIPFDYENPTDVMNQNLEYKTLAL